MTDDIIRTLDYEKIFNQEKIEQIKEEFISFYGEERRAEIESKFANMKVIPYIRKKRIKDILDAPKKAKSEKILKEIEESLENSRYSCANKAINWISETSFEESPIFKYYEYVDTVKRVAREQGERAALSIPCPSELGGISHEISARNILNDYKESVPMNFLNAYKNFFKSKLSEYQESVGPIKDENGNIITSESVYDKVRSNAQKQIESIDFIQKFDLDYYLSKGFTAIAPLICRKNGQADATFVILIEIDTDVEELDHSIFHEFNHLIEINPKNITDRGMDIVNAWETSHEEFDEDGIPVSVGKKNEQINEIINDMIAEKICRNYHAKGNRVFSDPSTAVYTSAYRDTMPIMGPFFDIVSWDTILKSRSDVTGGVAEVTKIVGEENFAAFGQLFEDYTDLLHDFKKVRYLSDLIKGKGSEYTDRKKEMLKKGTEIIRAMKEYSATHSKSYS